MRLTVKIKFIAVFVSVVILVGLFGWMNIVRMQQLQKNTNEIVLDWMKGIEIIENIHYSVEHIDFVKYQIVSTQVVKERTALFTDLTNTMTDVDQKLLDYKRSLTGEVDIANYTQLEQEWTAYKNAFTVFEKAKLYSQEMKEATSNIDNALSNVKQLVIPMVLFNQDGAANAQQENTALSNSNTQQILLGISIIIVLIVVIAILIVRSVSIPVQKASIALNRIADGDLTVETIVVRNKDEFGTMIHAVNRMVLHLRESVNQMHDASNKVASSSEQLLANSKNNADASNHVTISVQEVATGAEIQAQSSVECSRAMDEMSVGIQRIAETASDVSELSISATDNAKKGTESMQRVLHKMQAVSTAVDNANGVLKDLEVHSHNIGQISTLIGNISAQTNLLALNAAIEAARAGESGKGFAVVANEVRKLASQTDQSIQDITGLINSIQQDSAKAVQVMSEGLLEVNEGLLEVSETEKAFDQIVKSSEMVALKVQETAAAAEQMAASSEEVAATVSNVGAVAQQTSATAQTVATAAEEQLASTEEIAASAKGLLDISQDLYKVVNTFKTDRSE
ncbi:methyl-accepting chemotaxis protein [Paenibacillus sp. IHBB 10380]|uniref:methyl-accepting chemotaxis protein n=1 Tax=Paenibacillus sp. IHBB 10380 TaxID=1566358 RepID=UPI000697AC71|nr:methyl-accepting chemotaxis protein [Paenibacillus sp. IHBB 10380]